MPLMEDEDALEARRTRDWKAREEEEIDGRSTVAGGEGRGVEGSCSKARSMNPKSRSQFH